jgi:O-antigen/teichoic acid export membrane protein
MADEPSRSSEGDDSPHGGVRLRSFLSESAIYGLGSVADKLIGFLLLPISTALLTPSDYGVLSIFGTTASLAYLLVSAGQHQVVAIMYANERETDERRRVFGTAIALGAAFSFFLIAVTFVLGPWIGPTVFGSSARNLVYVLGLFTLFDVVRKLAQVRFRLQERPRTFVVVNTVSTIVLRALAIAATALGFGAFGWVFGETIGIVATVAVFWPMALRDVKPRIDRRLAAVMIPLGLSLTPSMLAHWVMMGADRYVMLAAIPNAAHEIGLYAVGERISTVMQLVNVAFVLGWQRYAFENLIRPDGPRRFAHGLTLYAAVGGYCAFALSLLGDDLTRFITPATYNAGVVVIPMLTLAGFIGGISELTSARLQQANLGVRLSIATWVATIVQVGLLFWAIPRHGIQGAAAASVVGQSIKFVLIMALVQQSVPVPFEFRRLLLLVVVFTAAYALGGSVGEPDSLTRCFWQIGIVAATPLLVVGSGFLAEDEKARLRAGLRRLIPGRTQSTPPLSNERDKD